MRQLKLEINKKTYVLELDRTSVKWLEAVGFNMEDFLKKPITFREYLWTSLFLKNHKDVNPTLAIKLMDTYASEHSENMVNKVVRFAYEEYDSFINALTDTDSEKMEEELEIIEQ